MHMKTPLFSRASRRRAAFTLMELLVVVSIILVLAAIALPVYGTVMSRMNKAVALNNMRQITAALISYAGQNDGDFPQENIPAGSSWANAANPDLGGKVWYNALPRMAGSKGAGDYSSAPATFYAKGNLLFLPGAQYPNGTGSNGNKLERPFFAYGINTKLQRKEAAAEGAPKVKGTAKLSQITMPARTVAFSEGGIPGEPKAMAIQPAYEGEPKTAGRSFVERYGGQGVVTFLDGHAEAFAAKDLLSSAGLLIWNTGEVPRVIWCRTPEENPN